MDKNFIECLRKYYEDVLKLPEAPMNQGLSVFDFCRFYGDNPEPWRIGPFIEEKGLAFHKTKQWKDKTHIGWKSSSLFNPSCIIHDGKIFMAYRAAPRKEVLCSYIGMAVYDETNGWRDYECNPVIYPTEADELWGCEDPKLYKLNNKFFMFYQAVFQPDQQFCDEMNAVSDFKIGIGATVTKAAVSDDLIHWTKLGAAVPLEVSKGWSKGAVIPRDGEGQPVLINGKYLMYVSSGCGAKQTVGFSDDLIHWDFKAIDYLKLPPGDWYIEEVACASTCFDKSGKALVLDFYYQSPDIVPRAGQVLYNTDRPFEQLEIRMDGGTLSWGGMLRYRNRWLFSQGWDSPRDKEDIYFYSAPVYDFSLLER